MWNKITDIAGKAKTFTKELVNVEDMQGNGEENSDFLEEFLQTEKKIKEKNKDQ